MRRFLIYFSLILLVLPASSAIGQHFEFDINQGNHSLLVEESRINGEFTEAGDEVGVFTPAGLCAGATVYEEAGDVAIGIAAWADDPDQAGVNGFRAGQAIAYRFWDRGTQHELEANPEYVFGPEVFERDAFSVLNLSGELEGPPIVVIREGENVLGENQDEMAHDFGNVLVDDHSNWVFTIGNGGIDPLVIESMVMDPGVFTSDFPEEGMTIEAGEGADVTVTFSPAEEVAYDGSLTIVSNLPSGDVVIRLIGTGTVEHIPDIDVSPANVNFGDVEVGHPATTDLTVSNRGNSDLTLSGMNVQGDAYSINFDGETVIEAGGNLVFQITFDPSAAGDFAGMITITSDDPDEGEVEVGLNGHGFVVPAPNIVADAGEIDFGDVVVGSIGSALVTITNEGDEPLGITDVATDNEVFTTDYEDEAPQGPRFAYALTDGNHSILILEALLNGSPLEVDDEIGAFSPAGLCVGAVVLADEGDGVFPAGLAAWGDDINEQGINGLRNGEAISFRYWDLSARRELAAEAEVVDGELNYGRDNFTIVNLSARNQRQPADIQETVLQPGQSLEINVFFEPTDFVDYEGILTVSSNDPDSPELEIALTGRGSHEPPQINLSDEVLDFGSIVVGTSVEQTLTISNTGVSPLEGSLELEGGQGADFFTFAPADFAIESERSLDITVTFSPDEVGDWSAILHVLSNDRETPDVGVGLIGYGREREPNIFVFFEEEEEFGYHYAQDFNAHDFGQVFIGESETWDLAISNRGEVALTIERIDSDEDAFEAQLDQPLTIEPGQSASVTILFTPREERGYEGILTIISNDPDVGEFQLLVVGAGVLERLPDIALDFRNLDFEALIIGSEMTREIVGVNSGLADLTIPRVVVEGNAFSSDFQGDLVVSPDDGFAIPITFAPDEVGDFAGTATIFSDDPDEGQVVVQLTGRAIPEGDHFQFTITAENMSIIVEDATLDGAQLVAGDEVAVFTPGGFCAGATLVTDEWPIGVAAWGEDNNQEGPDGFRDGEAIEWRIWDQSSGSEYAAAADYSVADGFYQTNGFAVVTLSSRHVPTPRIALGVESIDFGLVLSGAARSMTFNIANVGDGVLTIENIVTDGAPFAVDFDGEISIEPEASIDVEVSFQPEEAGEFVGALTVFSNDPDNREITVNLFGAAVEPSPAQIALSDDQHVFGEIGAGDREVWELIVSNVGGDVLSVDAPSLDGDGFEVSPEMAFDLDVGESTVLQLTFAPQNVGEYQATLTLNSNDPDNGEITVALAGAAVASPLHFRFQQTDGNMSLLVESATLDGQRLAIGSEVGVFTSDGISAGSVRIEEYPFGLAAWGDDVTTENIVEGFVEGEALSYRIYLPDLGAEFAAAPEYSEGEGIYHRDAFAVLSLSSTSPEDQGHFFFSITNANHSILALSAILNDEPLSIGDEVAVFTPRGLCAGAAILEEAGDQPFGFAAWGDDLDTQPVEGFTNGETMSYRYWDVSASQEYSGVEAFVEEGPEEYTPNGFTVLRLDHYALPQPEINLELAHDFGLVPVGDQAGWDFVISNDGNAELLLSSVGDLGAPFSVNFEGEATVAAGESVTYTVTFAPEEARDYEEMMLVFSNDRNEPRLEVSLTGSGFNPNHAPVWVNPPQVVEGEEASHLEFTLQASDPDGDRLSMRMVHGELQGRAEFTDHGNGTGTFSWTPGYLDAGEYIPLFIVSDGEFEVEVEVTIVISNVNAPPEFVDFPDGIMVDEGSQTAFDVTARDIDGDRFALDFEFVGGSPEVLPEVTDHGEGFFTFTWSPGFDDAGEYTLRLHLLSDHPVTPDIELDIDATVNDVNRAPEVANPIEDGEVNEDSGTTNIADLDEVFVDLDGDDLSFEVTGRDELGIGVDGNNVLSITPAANFNGEGEINITASDGRDAALVAFHANGLSGSAQAARTQPQRRMRSVQAIAPVNEAVNRDSDISESFTVTVLPVNDAPRWTQLPAQAPRVDEDALIEFDVAAADIDLDGLELTFVRGNFPQEATFEDHGDRTGTFRWQTGFASSGNYRGELMVSDGELTDRYVLFVTVRNVNRPPVWDDVPEQVNGRENTEIRFDIVGSDPDNNALTITMINDNLPDQAALQDHHDGTATFVWRPSFEEAGDYTATFRISDNAENVDAEVPFHIADVNRPPLVEAIPDADVDEDANRTNLYRLADFFSDPDGDRLNYSVAADGSVGAAIDAGVLSVEPADNVNGDFDIVVTAADAEFRVSDEFVLTINATNDRPFWVNPVRAVTVREGERIEFALHADDVDLAREGDELNNFLRVEDRVIQRGANYDHAGANGTFIWNTDFDDAGVYRPLFRVEDRAGAVDDVEVTITINNANRAPEISEPTREENFQVNARENSELRVEFAADDPDGDDIRWTLPDVGGMPGGFQFTDHEDGTATLLWTPPFDARREPYTPLAVATDEEGATDRVRLSISVANLNRLPVIEEPANAEIFRVAVEEGRRLEVNFRSTDADGGAPDWRLIDRDGLPNGFQFADNGGGRAQFVWDVPFDARRQPYTPLFRTSDAEGGTDEIVVEITVRNRNRAPVISQPGNQDVVRVNVNENSELRIGFLAADPDDDNIAWAPIDDGGLPGGWAFNDIGAGRATFVWRPGFDDSREEPYSPVFQVSDGQLTDDMTVEMTVVNINRLPERRGQIDDLVVNEDEGRFDIGDLNPFFFDPDGDALQFSFSGDPAGLGMDLENGNVLFINPDADFNLPGGALITVTATDGAGQASQQFRVTVTPVNDSPAAFSLRAPQDRTVLVNYRGTFIWNRSTDVDNDQVRYSIVFTFIDAPIDSTFRIEPLQDTTYALTGLDTLMAEIGLEDTLRIRWWVEATDGQMTRESGERWTFAIPPLSAPDEDVLLPTEISLSQNYPNPFNPETKLRFALPRAGDVKLTVFDMHARSIATIAAGRFAAGRHEVTWNAAGNTAGIYLFVLQANGERRIVKGAMLK